MKKTLAILFAALCCITANAQEINAVVARQNGTTQEMVRLANSPNVILNEDGITLKEGETNVESYSFDEGNVTVLFASAISGTESTESLAHPVVIENGGKLTVSGEMSNTNAQDLVIKDGGQLVFSEGNVKAMVEKEIEAYGESNGNWYLVASPVAGTDAPAGMIDETADNYDLYIFNQSSEDGKEWNNYKANAFGIGNQNGYLYAHKNGTKLTFNGQLMATAQAKPLVYDGNADFPGFNLVGNPYPCNATISGTNLRSSNYFYRMNAGGTALEVVASPVIAPCTGVFAVANGSNATVTFAQTSDTANVTRSEKNALRDIRVELIANGNIINRAYLNTNGESLPKFTLNGNTSEICFHQNKEELAVASISATRGEMPLNFKAVKNGTYTLTVNVGNVEATYLHLIDNLTGEDTDLLAIPSYTFNASTSDYTCRFKLVFNVTMDVANDGNDGMGSSFAYISNGEIIVSNEGRATLQVIDAMGRIIRNQQIEGEARISTQGLTAGVYVLSLNGKTQKIVVR